MSEQAFQHLHCNIVQGTLVVTLTERRLDSEKLIDELRSELFAAVESHNGVHVVLDLRNVQMLQTLVLRMWIDLRKKVIMQGGRVVLCGLQPVIQEVLRITGFIDQKDESRNLFETHGDVSAALARINGTP